MSPTEPLMKWSLNHDDWAELRKDINTIKDSVIGLRERIARTEAFLVVIGGGVVIFGSAFLYQVGTHWK